MNDSAPAAIERPKGWDLVPPNETLVRQAKSGARWMYWIAGLSAANAILTHVDAPIRFSMGLGMTEVVYAVGQQLGAVGATVAAILDLIFLAGLVAIGYFGTKRHGWAFVLGITILVLDTILLLALTGLTLIMGLVFHLLAVAYLWTGYRALRVLQQRQAEGNA